MSSQQKRKIKVGSWLADSTSLKLVRDDGVEVKLQPKLMNLLLLLASKPGEVFSRDSLVDEIWSDTSATNDTINNAVGRLRKTLAASDDGKKYIETVPKLGYRLCVEVSVLSNTPNAQPEKSPNEIQSETEIDTTKTLKSKILLLSAMLILGSIVLVGVLIPEKNINQERIKTEYRLNLQQPIREVLISNNLASEIFPAISPNAKEVVFVRVAPTMDSTSLVVKQVDDENEVIITEQKGLYSNPVWAPDGQNIAFIEIGLSGCRVLSVSSRGGPSQFISECSPALVSTLRPVLAWSPDGNSLIVPKQVAVKNTHALFSVDIATGITTQLTFPPDNSFGDAHPAYSPSGEKLAFTRTSENFTDSILVATINQSAESKPEKLSLLSEQSIAPIMGLTWLNEKEIIYSSSERNIYEIWSLNLNTKRKALLGVGGHGIVHPQFNIETQSLVMAEMDANSDIVIRELRTGGTEIVKELASTRWERAASISNNQNLVAYIRLVPNGTELWLHDITLDKTERILKTSQFIAGISWSPDDTKVALTISSDFKTHIEIYERHSLRQYKLPILKTDNQQSPIWSGDGESLIYTSKTNGVWSVWQTQITELITKKLLNNVGGQVALDTELNNLFFTKDGERGFWQYTLDSVKEPQLVGDSFSSKVVIWDYDDGYFYYVKETGRMLNTIYKFDPATNQEIVIYQGLPFNEMDIRGSSLVTSDLKEFSGDVLLRQYVNSNSH